MYEAFCGKSELWPTFVTNELRFSEDPEVFYLANILLGTCSDNSTVTGYQDGQYSVQNIHIFAQSEKC